MIREKTAKRIKAEAIYIIHTNDSLRNTADIFGISKSTLHTDVTKNLKDIDINLFNQVKLVLDDNKHNTNP